MDDNTSGAICDYLCQHIGIDGIGHEGSRAEGVVRRALTALPQPEARFCVPVEGTGMEPTVFLLAGDRLIQVRACYEGAEASCVTVRSKSWPLVDSTAVIELAWGKHEATQESVHIHTSWDFDFQDGSSISLPGLVKTLPEPGPDEGEEFARAVAARLGQSVGAPDS